VNIESRIGAGLAGYRTGEVEDTIRLSGPPCTISVVGDAVWGHTVLPPRELTTGRYFEATTAAPTAAWPAANRAVWIRKGEHDT
jgi:hypothetical protein